MCDICKAIEKSKTYRSLMEKMVEADKEKMAFSKEYSANLPLSKFTYTSMKWPVMLIHPMFEARAAYCVPHNYFQNLLIDGERCGVAFSHGSMRSVFFVDDRLVLFSKTVNHAEGREFFTSFILTHFNENEFSYRFDGDDITLSADVEKPMKNLITGKVEKKRISFNFIGRSVKNRIVSKEQVMSSAHFRAVYEKYGTAAKKVASIDLEGYAITVPHFSPHPYLLQIHEELGFGSNRELQEHVIDYFRFHLKKE